jgi:HSP20 family molecular chaperone IbpA
LLTKEKVYFAFPLRFSGEGQQFFNELIRQPWVCNRELRVSTSAVYLYEIDDAFILEADLSGVCTDPVRIDIDGAELVLQWQHEPAGEVNNGPNRVLGRTAQECLRRIPLPESVAQTAIDVKFKNGVLRVLIAKTKSVQKT